MLRLSFHDIKRNGIEYNKMGAVYEHFFVLLKYFRCNAEDVTPLPEALPYGYELPRLDSEASRQLVSSTILLSDIFIRCTKMLLQYGFVLLIVPLAVLP